MGARFIVFVSLTVSALIGNVLAQARNERVVGGQVAKKNIRKHLAHVWIHSDQEDVTWTCTGTVIGRRHVLTAAHCFDIIDYDPSLVSSSRLYVGLKTATPDSEDTSYTFDSVYMHKNYDPFDTLPRNDIAIIRLSQRIKKSSYHPITRGKEPSEDTVVIGAGYGALDESGTRAKFAMQTNLIAKGFSTCRSYESPSIRRHLSKKVHTCAVSLGFPDEGRTDTCYGDSGGPLLRKKGKKVIQYGITSFATSGCAAAGGTPWYTRVSTYRKDIRDIMRKGRSKKFWKYT